MAQGNSSQPGGPKGPADYRYYVSSGLHIALGWFAYPAKWYPYPIKKPTPAPAPDHLLVSMFPMLVLCRFDEYTSDAQAQVQHILCEACDGLTGAGRIDWSSSSHEFYFDS